MRAEYTYVLSIIDESTEELETVLVRGQHKLLLLISRLPVNKTFLSSQNLGVTIDEDEYMRKQDDDQGMNFGQGGQQQ
jgi:hypothetical protein